MSLAEAFAPYESHYKSQVMANTWGHLAPEERKVYTGYIIFTYSDYGNIALFRSQFKGLNDSPWFFDHAMEFIDKKAKKEGSIYKFTGTYMMFKNGKGRFSGKVTRIKL